MDIERILRKLEPLRPQQVHRWRQLRDTVDATLRALLDQEIMHTVHHVLGDHRSKLLLSLPPEKTAKAAYHLGTVLYEQDKWPAGITTAELLQNVSIFGRSGAGKTNVTFHLLEQLTQRRVPWIFLDWKRTARHLIPRLSRAVHVYTPGRTLSPFPFNPFIVPPSMETRVYIHHVVDVLADAFTLGDGARSVLHRALAACYAAGDKAPSVADVLTQLERASDAGRAGGWKVSATRALESVDFAALTGQDRQAQEQMADTLLKQNTVVELDALGQGSKRFLIPLLCLWLYSVQLASAKREQLGLVIVIEEAHHVLHRHAQSAKESVMEMLLRQCREMGISIIVVDQHPSLISPAVLGNTYTSICLNLKDPGDIARAAALSLVDDSERRCFSELPVGQAVVKLQDRWRKPFLIRVPHVPVAKGAVTDALLGRLMRGEMTRSALRRAVAAENGPDGRFRAADAVLGPGELTFIGDVLAHPYDGVNARYQRLGLSADRGNRLKERLIQNGMLDAQAVKMGRTRKLLLRVSDAARRHLGLTPQTLRRGGLAHEYWKHWYAALYREQGYRVTLEAPRNGGNIDVLATRARERVGIEVETGKSNVIANVRRCLRARLVPVLVVATDEQALATVERQLGQAGLLIAGRVTVVLRDRHPRVSGSSAWP